MSIKVEMAELAARIDEYGFAYLVTVGDGGAAHVLAVLPETTGDGIAIGGLGSHSVANAAARPDVTLVWPPSSGTGYSLIVDGTATVGDGALTVTPRKAILHRPALDDAGQRTGSDCQAV